MKVTLIQPPQDKINNDRLEPPLGLMYLSSVLRQYKHDVSILDFTGGHCPNIPESDIYGFCTYTPAYSWCLRKKKEINLTHPDALMIAGGPHVSSIPDKCSEDWDAIVVSEGENAILKIILGERGIIYGEPMNINEIPFPSYDIIDIDTYSRTLMGNRALSILTSRGCPYKCAFCNSTVMGCGRGIRFRDVSNVAQEIRWLKNKYRVTSFRFLDDLFAVTRKRVEELCYGLKPLNIIYRCNGKVNVFDDIIAGFLKDSGCVAVAFGVESGSNEILRKMNKQQTREDAKRATKSAKKFGLRVRWYLIVGFPGETWETVQETVDLALESQPDEIIVMAPVPFPGTQLYLNPERFGITQISKDFDEYLQIRKSKQASYVLEHATADAAKIQQMRDYVIDELSEITWVT